MPGVVSRAHRHTQASDLPDPVWRALQLNECAANIILPFAKTRRALDSPSDEQQLWIVQYDDPGNVDDPENVEFVLSCTKGALGNYPIFVFTPKSSAQLEKEEKRGKDITESISELVSSLLEAVPPERVFSVFSITKVAKKFAQIFEEKTLEHGIRSLVDNPYYDATFTFCTREMLNNPSVSISSLPESEDIIISLRRADMSHLDMLRILCKEFSETSPPYALDDQGATREATALITNQQAWVHMIKKGDEEWDIACLVAATRESDNVTAITKVYAPARWRGLGCAARLMHRVCQEILQNKQRVVLYVGNGRDLAPARRVYQKVGFQGLGGDQPVEGVEKWLEIGFTPTTLGYW
ncbi:hypothetical protein BS17DRAFT_701202 [Gyrodon lividus]|nr:hypothetical protein BS17DRAFT_701202 [Gyrodon lividus]